VVSFSPFDALQFDAFEQEYQFGPDQFDTVFTGPGQGPFEGAAFEAFVIKACLRFEFRGKKRQFFDETTCPDFMSGRRENGRLANPDNYREPDHFSNEVSSKKGRFFSGS